MEKRRQKGQVTIFIFIGIGILIITASVLFALHHEERLDSHATEYLARSDAFSILDSRTREVRVQRTFQANGDYPLNIEQEITGLGVNASFVLESDASLARIILIGADGEEHLIYEAYPLLSGTHPFTTDTACVETCILDPVTPKKVRIEIKDASVTINAFSYSTTQQSSNDVTARQIDIKKQQESIKIKLLNDEIKAAGMRWIAGETSVSSHTYQEKKRLFTRPDGTVPAELPDLQGFEYYKGGIFELRSTSRMMSDGMTGAVTSQGRPARNAVTGRAIGTSNATIPRDWDWRNVHGENWMTPVKDQGPCNSCWAFATVGSLEAVTNLYFNGHIDPDISEQDLISCSGAGNCNEGGASLYALNYASSTGVTTTACFPYQAEDVACSAKCADWTGTTFRTTGVKTIFSLESTEDAIKQEVISSGPGAAALCPLSHIETLVGWSFDDRDGETVWIYKNSWGVQWGDQGYAYMKIPPCQVDFAIAPIIISGDDHTINCVDKDKDMYCNWGIAQRERAECPANCLPEEDCDDSNPRIGKRPCSSIASESCHDSRTGPYEPWFEMGTITVATGTYPSRCINETQLQYYTCLETSVHNETRACKNGCADGACNVCIDRDHDGYNSTNEEGYAASLHCRPTDCDDLNAAIQPTAKELCNGLDDDCDSRIDEGCSGQQPTCTDSDGGVNTFGRGIVNGAIAEGISYTRTDDCVDAATVNEQFCDGTRPVKANIPCPPGSACDDGACTANGSCGGHAAFQCPGNVCDPGSQACIGLGGGYCFYCCEDITHTCGTTPAGSPSCQATDITAGYYDPDCAGT